MDLTIASEQELLKAFRSRDRKHVLVPKSFRFPLNIGHYLAWTEPSGVRIFLVFKKPGWKTPVGVAFRRDHQGTMGSPTGVCDWCIAHGPADQIGLLTTTVDSKRRVGVNLCLDLSCIHKLESTAQMAGIPLEPMAAKLIERMARFCNEALDLRGEPV